MVSDDNTAEFWSLWDKLVKTSNIVIEHPAGSRHTKYENFIYPTDYGYLEDTVSSDSEGMDIWVGSDDSLRICGCIVTLDILKRDSEIKLLFACTPNEIKRILEVHNHSDNQKGVLIVR